MYIFTIALHYDYLHIRYEETEAQGGYRIRLRSHT